MVYELTHICGPAKSLRKNEMPSISDLMWYHPETKSWYAGDDDGETTVKVKFCPFCGVELSTLENVKQLQAE